MNILIGKLKNIEYLEHPRIINHEQVVVFNKMKFGLFILSAIAYLGSCDVSDSLGYANLKTREMLSSKINGNVEGILARTFGEAQPKAQGFVSLPVALAVETNSNYFQDDGGIIGKKYITPI